MEGLPQFHRHSFAKHTCPRQSFLHSEISGKSLAEHERQPASEISGS